MKHIRKFNETSMDPLLYNYHIQKADEERRKNQPKIDIKSIVVQGEDLLIETVDEKVYKIKADRLK